MNLSICVEWRDGDAILSSLFWMFRGTKYWFVKPWDVREHECLLTNIAFHFSNQRKTLRKEHWVEIRMTNGHKTMKWCGLKCTDTMQPEKEKEKTEISFGFAAIILNGYKWTALCWFYLFMEPISHFTQLLCILLH